VDVVLEGRSGGTAVQLHDELVPRPPPVDPSAVLNDLEWLRGAWGGSLVVKGIQHLDDARTVVEAGADAVVVSKHGRRQLDRAPAPLRLLPDIVDAVGKRAEILIDTAALGSADLVSAVGLGATGVMVGRAYLYGLMAGGERGVDRALAIFATETRRTHQLLSVRSLSRSRSQARSSSPAEMAIPGSGAVQRAAAGRHAAAARRHPPDCESIGLDHLRGG
jgi:L-lactate dehydrogenase (cytochrome)